MATLYQLSLEMQAILLADDEGELTAETEERLTECTLAFEAKVEAVLGYRQELLADAAALADECKRLKAKADTASRRADWLKAYVLAQMQATGTSKVTTPHKLFTAAIQLGPPAVKVEREPDAFEDSAYFREIPARLEWDKDLIKSAVKAGAPLPAGVEVIRTPYLKVS